MTAAQIDFATPGQTGLVSVVIPSYNRAKIIGRAIESILDQTYTNLEVVVADDGSTDDTRAVVEAYGDRVRYVYQKNGGVASARNLGIRHSRGEFVALLDSDDAWMPWKLEAQVATLRRHEKVVLVWSDMTAIDPDGAVIRDRHLRVMYTAHAEANVEESMAQVDTIGDLTASAPAYLSTLPVRCGDLSALILLGNLIHTSTVMFRRDLVLQVGGLDESWSCSGEDYEFHVRLCSLGPVALIDAPSALYRVGAEDQLTAPRVLLNIARNSLRTVQTHMPRIVARQGLTPETVRRRIAGSFAWVGEAELDSGNHLTAARWLTRSLTTQPQLDRRAMLLAMCAVPKPVLRRLRSAKQAIRDVVRPHKTVGVEGAA